MEVTDLGHGPAWNERTNGVVYNILVKLWERNNDITVDEAEDPFTEAVIKDPDLIRVVIRYYITAHLRALNRKLPEKPKPIDLDKALAFWIKTAILPNGKTILDSTGAELVKLGGKYTKLGKKVGPRNIAGKKFSVDEIVAIWG